MNDDRSKLVPFERARRMPDPARVAEFAATARRLQYERETSVQTVARALRETSDWLSLAHREELHTSGALEALSKEIDARLDARPREALQLARLAVDIADRLDSYPAITLAQVRAHARKDLGLALTCLAQYGEALRAFDRAEAHLSRYGTLAHDQAIVRFVRATALQHLRRFDEARALLEECTEVFRDHGDARLYAKCALATGNLLVRRGDYQAAHAILAPLIGGHGNDLHQAILRCTLGWCAIHLDRPAEALSHFHEVAFHTRGSDLHLARAAYGAGAALLRLGRYDEALDELGSAREMFLLHGLVEEAGLSGLEMVEARLLRDEVEAAKALSARIVREFTEAQLSRRAIAALAYLNEAVRGSTATPEFVRNVHTYIDSLRVDPDRDVAAPVN